MKILLLGKNGQVGWELQRSLAPLGELIALDADSQELCGDFTDLDGLVRTGRSIAPDVFVYAAALGGRFAKSMPRRDQVLESLTVSDHQTATATGASVLADTTAHAILTARQ